MDTFILHKFKKQTNNKSPQIVGLRPPMCLQNLLVGKKLMRIHWIFWCICNYYDFITPINSKCCSTCYCLAVIWRGSLGEPNFGGWGIRVDLGVRNCANRKPTHDFPIPLITKFCYICHRLAPIPISSYGRPIRTLPPPIWWVRVDLERQWYQSKSHPHIHIQLLYTL